MKDGHMSRAEKERVKRALEDPLLNTLSDYRDHNTNKARHDASTAKATKTTLDSKIQDVNSDLFTKASMELPMKWDGNALTVKKNMRTSIACGIPANINNGRWSATVSASSIVRGPMGCASGGTNLVYHPSILKGTQIHGGLQVGDQANLSVGGVYRRHKSSVGVSVVSRQRTSSLVASVSAQHKFRPCLINGKLTLTSSSSSWNVSASPLAKPHRIQLGVGWSRSKPLLHLMLRPKFSTHRSGTIDIRWNGDWSLGAALNQSISSKVASLGVGICLCKKQLEWIFTFHRGDVKIRIPVIITQYQNVWMNCLQVVYLSVLSEVIQDVIADLWNLNINPEANEALRMEQHRMKRNKARSDAEQQQKLMLRQAKSRAKVENTKEGLVIRNAVYHGIGGDSWDVTTPLQFWTENSSLELPPSSKKDLLGFYNVACVKKNEEIVNQSWLAQLWGEPTLVSEPKAPTPTLTVQYYYAKRLYEITIEDDEQLVLPSSKAAPVPE
jgi:hypothetical protein